VLVALEAAFGEPLGPCGPVVAVAPGSGLHPHLQGVPGDPQICGDPSQRGARRGPVQVDGLPPKLGRVRLAGHDRGSSRLPGSGRIQHVQDPGSRPDLSTEQLMRTYYTNVFAAFWLCKAAVQHMQAGSSIIVTTSILAYQPSRRCWIAPRPRSAP
jgi:hypothetical protein